MTIRRTVRRLLWKALAYLGDVPLTLRTRHGRLSFSSRDRGVGRRLFLDRELEWATIERAVVLARRLGYLQPRDPGCLLDVGANIGTVCIAMVRDGVVATARAFEPEPTNYRYLRRNICQNGLDGRILAFDVALSSANGTAELELSSNSGDHRLRAATPPAGPERYHEGRRSRITVPVRRLDDFLDAASISLKEVRLLWMDVQGHEKHVLEGAAKVLDAGVPVVAEFWPYGLARAGVSPGEFSAFVALRFSRYWDLREAAPAARPAGEIATLFARHSHFKSFTDLLLAPR